MVFLQKRRKSGTKFQVILKHQYAARLIGADNPHMNCKMAGITANFSPCQTLLVFISVCFVKKWRQFVRKEFAVNCRKSLKTQTEFSKLNPHVLKPVPIAIEIDQEYLNWICTDIQGGHNSIQPSGNRSSMQVVSNCFRANHFLGAITVLSIRASSQAPHQLKELLAMM